ncbi:MAG TPA: MmgE/PrpD family protein, partial [Terriglobales bacterium]|nr:MmgE/PrpD family protein [Terriglobales bacterium]
MSDTLHKSTEGLSRKLAEFAQSFELAQAPTEVISNAKLAILDCLGVSVLATRQEIGDCLNKFAKANASTGDCTVWGLSLKASVRDAAFLNGTLAHGLDYDDRNHSTTYTLAASIATAESVNANGRQALEAFIVGREVRATLDRIFSARSSGVGPGARGWHSNGILGPIAAACSASRIYRLNPRQTLAAIGLSAGACGALTRDGGTMAKPFRCGHAAATGVTSALLAQAGFSSDETVLEGRYGLLDAVGPLGDEILESLGKKLGIEWDLAHSLRIKPFASCTATHSGLEAMLRLRQREKITADEVEAIDCDLRPYPLVRARPTRGYEGRFSMP